MVCNGIARETNQQKIALTCENVIYLAVKITFFTLIWINRTHIFHSLLANPIKSHLPVKVGATLTKANELKVKSKHMAQPI